MSSRVPLVHKETANNDCDPNSLNAGTSETQQLLNTLLINAVVFVVLMLCFEASRNLKSIYLKRLTKERLVNSGRVPPVPPRHMFGWVGTLAAISEDDLLHMVGLDGYMLMRYINICFRISAFLTLWGLVVLVPVYGNSSGGNCGWSKYTLANVPNGDEATGLWAPTVLAYVFAAYFCQMMHAEYENFLEKRVQYLIRGDPSTPLQSYHTIMLERVPGVLRSAPRLRSFFESLFAGDVHSVELACDLEELEALVAKRHAVRDNLEKALALLSASGRAERPLAWVSRSALTHARSPDPSPPALQYGEATAAGLCSPCLCPGGVCGQVPVDAIEHYSLRLAELNAAVKEKQGQYFQAAQAQGQGQGSRRRSRTGSFQPIASSSSTGSASSSGGGSSNAGKGGLRAQLSVPRNPEPGDEEAVGAAQLQQLQQQQQQQQQQIQQQQRKSQAQVQVKARQINPSFSSQHSGSASASIIISTSKISNGSNGNNGSNGSLSLATPARAVTSVEGLAQEGIHAAEQAAKGAVRGVLEAARTLEMLTVGSFYHTSSTAFVTFRTRLAASSSHQMLLSHNYISMQVRPAPNPRDIIWENVSIPQRQIDIRRVIADVTLVVGALFWSLVLGFITTIASLESLGREYPWLQTYSDTDVYKLVNSYLASSLLLTLLTLLPFIFDVIARAYEGLKLESEVQNSIMTRYFYYQLANVFVSVYAGSIVTALHQILDSPSSILSILGTTIPSFSVYFANLVIVKTFTAIPLEMLRVWPLVQILGLKLFLDKKKCTWRELRTGAFADPPLLYGSIYPSLMMVLMIVVTYACISPLLTPLAVGYYALAYLMYKYQLLYVYVNDYQSGGFMWYAVFTRSMVALICGVVTLICYLGIRKTYFSGPFYVLLPLPLLIALFWTYCENKFRDTSSALSRESAMDLDRAAETASAAAGGADHAASFSPRLYRQPALAEGPLRPAPYRKGAGAGAGRGTNATWAVGGGDQNDDEDGAGSWGWGWSGHSPLPAVPASNPDVERGLASSHEERLLSSHHSDEFQPDFDGEDEDESPAWAAAQMHDLLLDVSPPLVLSPGPSRPGLSVEVELSPSRLQPFLTSLSHAQGHQGQQGQQGQQGIQGQEQGLRIRVERPATAGLDAGAEAEAEAKEHSPMLRRGQGQGQGQTRGAGRGYGTSA